MTTASRGIGRAIPEELANEGANVSICARGKEDLVQAAADTREHGARVPVIQVDGTRTESAQRAVDVTIQEFGRIDILVNNAGNPWVGRSVNTTDEEWRYAMDVRTPTAPSGSPAL